MVVEYYIVSAIAYGGIGIWELYQGKKVYLCKEEYLKYGITDKILDSRIIKFNEVQEAINFLCQEYDHPSTNKNVGTNKTLIHRGQSYIVFGQMPIEGAFYIEKVILEIKPLTTIPESSCYYEFNSISCLHPKTNNPKEEEGYQEYLRLKKIYDPE
jgi:hypothetical protein